MNGEAAGQAGRTAGNIKGDVQWYTDMQESAP